MQPISLLLPIFRTRVVQYSQIDSVGVCGDKKGLHWWLAYRTRNMNNNYSALLLGLKANFFCTNRTIGMTSFSISTNRTIGTNRPSKLTNRIRLCILDMSGGLSFVVNENNANPTCIIFGSEPVRCVGVIRTSLISYYLAGPLF